MDLMRRRGAKWRKNEEEEKEEKAEKKKSLKKEKTRKRYSKCDSLVSTIHLNGSSRKNIL